MARSVNTIYQNMLTEKLKYSSLNNLTSTSNVAVWRTIFYICAIAIATFEQLLDVFKQELLDTAETLPTGSTIWYAQKLLQYQAGYELEYNRETEKLEYPVEDDDAKIIIASSCVQESDTVVMKVAKSDGLGGLTNLTTEEQTGVLNYINSFKFAGTVTRLITLPGDYIHLEINIKVNASKILTNGESASQPGVYPVEDAINNYLLEFATENFNSEFKLIDLEDALQSVDGVTNFLITVCMCKPVSGSVYYDVLESPFRTYIGNSGYLQIDPSHSLRDGLTYIA